MQQVAQTAKDTSNREPVESYPAAPPPPSGLEDTTDMPDAPKDSGAPTPAVDEANGPMASPTEAGGDIRDLDEVQEQPVSTSDGNDEDWPIITEETARPFGSGPDAQGREEDNSIARESPVGSAFTAVGDGGVASPSPVIQEPQPPTSNGRDEDTPVTDSASTSSSVGVNTTSGTQGTGIRSVEATATY